MKRTMMFAAATSLFLFCLVSKVYAQLDIVIEDGKKVVAASQFMLSEAKKITSAKDIDRAWLVDNGHLLTKYGYDYMESGELMFSGEGKINMQEIGQKLAGRRGP
jgi:hypothetical protein